MNENGQVPNAGETDDNDTAEQAGRPMSLYHFTKDDGSTLVAGPFETQVLDGSPPHAGDMPKLAALLSAWDSEYERTHATTGTNQQPLFRLEQAQALPEVDATAWCEDAGERDSEISSFKDEDRRTMRVVVMRNGELAKQQVQPA